MATRLQLLYCSPVIPSLRGNGLAMRAGTMLQVLAESYQVSLLLIPLYTPPTGGLPPALAARCRRIVSLPWAPPAPSALPLPARIVRWSRRLPAPGHDPSLAALHRTHFDVIHVFRLATQHFVQPFLFPSAGGEPSRHLDLDDLESVTHRRLAALYRQNGIAAAGMQMEREAERYAAEEEQALRLFDRVYVCSEGDSGRLRQRGPHRAQLCVVPNAVRLPAAVTARSNSSPFTFLFVGTLGYYPNEDAMIWFCQRILPLIRRATDQPCRLRIVGAAPTAAVLDLARYPGVEVIGPVPDVGAWYSDAQAVVVPVRAGGGTRIKVLEAFSYQRPVVSTTVGVEGIAAHGEEQVLLGDTPEEFAAQCLRLLREPALVDRLVQRATTVLARAYTVDAMAARLASLPALPPR